VRRNKEIQALGNEQASVRGKKVAIRNESVQISLENERGRMAGDRDIAVIQDIIAYGRDLALSGDWAIARSKSKSAGPAALAAQQRQ
jgi:hypothetical protein